MADGILPQSGIYQIRNIVNGKVYVGSAVNIKTRWVKHRSRLSMGSHHSINLQRAWNKYGKDAFAFEVLEEIKDCNLLVSSEQSWIDRYGSFGTKGYNMSSIAGSMLGFKHRKETCKNMSDSRRGKTASDEHKRNISASLIGRKKSCEAKANMSLAQRGRKLSAETVAKMIGRKATAETRAKLSASHKGIQAGVKHPMFGRHHSGEVREKMRVAKLGKRGAKMSNVTRIKMSVAAHKVWANRAGRHSAATAINGGPQLALF